MKNRSFSAQQVVLLLLQLIGLNIPAMAEDLVQNDSISIQSFTGVPSLDTTPIAIEMGGISWTIPRNYLETARLYKNFRGAENYVYSATLVIVTTYPGFTGATSETIHCYKPLGACQNTIKLGELDVEYYKGIKQTHSQAIQKAEHLNRTDEYGLTKVEANGFHNLYVFYGGNLENSLVLSCSPGNADDALKACRVRFEIFSAPFMYEYDLAMLPHWREIHANIIRLLTSFHAGDIQ